MTRLVLVRHAQSAPSPELDEPDWPLSALGEEQARALVPVLRGLGVETLVSSPYQRAIATLTPFSDAAGLAIAVHDDLRERPLASAWLRDTTVVEAAVARMHADTSFALDGGESGHLCLARFSGALGRIAAAAPLACVAVGSHGGILGHLLGAHHPNLRQGFWRSIRNPHLFVFDWSPRAGAAPRFLEEITLDGADGVGERPVAANPPPRPPPPI